MPTSRRPISRSRIARALRTGFAGLACSALFASACGRPIELADDSVVEITGALPFDIAELPASSLETLRVTAEIPGTVGETALTLADDGTFTGSLVYDVGTEVEDSSEADLTLQVQGALTVLEQPVLLAELVVPVTLAPRDRVSVDAGELETTSTSLRFDVNRNGLSNIDDLQAGCTPGVSSAALRLSATDLQFPSGTDPGEVARQVVVLDNGGAAAVRYSARVVGGPGMMIGELALDGEIGGELGTELGADEPLELGAGDEALIVVTYAPVDTRYSTGFLVVESFETECSVRRSQSVRLIGNPDGRLSEAPTTATPPDDVDLGLPLDVGFVGQAALFSGAQLSVGALESDAAAVDVAGVAARSATLVRVPAATELGIALVDLPHDADLEVFEVSGNSVGAAIGVADADVVHPGTDVESVVLEPAAASRDFLIVVVEAAVSEREPAEQFQLFFRASSFPRLRAANPVEPLSGGVDGGTSITLFGAGFRPGVSVTLANRSATSVVVNADGTEITAVTPPGTLVAGLNPATVVVRNPALGATEAQYATRPDAYVYTPSAPEIISLSPSTGSFTEATEVTIRGTGFTDFFGPVEVEVNGVRAEDVQRVSDSRLVVEVPAASAPGAASVLVRVADFTGSQEATLAAGFTYVADADVIPVVTGLNPLSGPAGTSAVVGVSGSDFIEGASVFFGDEPALAVTFDDSTSLTVISPPLAAGTYPVRVRNPDGTTAVDEPVWTVFAAGVGSPLISFVDPDPVHALIAGDTVRVLGQNLSTLTGAVLTDGVADYSTTVLGAVDAVVTLRVDTALPVGSDYRARLTFASGAALSPAFAARAPQPYGGEVVAGTATDGQAFTFLLTGEGLFPAQLTALRFDGPETVTLTPAAATETSVRVDVTSLTQGVYDATLVYVGDVEIARNAALVVEGACGNGSRGGTEECDLGDLDGESCSSLGFVGGALTCNQDCSFNTASCNGCGNQVLDAAEQCDGAELGGTTCDSLGYTSGDVGCTAACTLDVSGCATCGDGIASAGEACDGADLRDASCTSLGFTTGQLGCFDSCGAYDIAPCERCGDDVCSGGETNATCSQDCLPTCNDGNDTCDAQETCGNCPTDCSTSCGTLTAVVTGDGQSVFIGQTLGESIVVVITDGNGTPVPGAVVNFSHPPGGRSLGTASDNTSVTGPAGTASAIVTLGFGVGTQEVTVTGTGPGGTPLTGLPVVLQFTANDVPAGTVYTILNVVQQNYLPHPSGASQFTGVGPPLAAAVADDGGAYVAATDGRIYHIAPTGLLTHIAGDGGGDYDGEGVPATEAGFSEPQDIVSDGEGGALVLLNALGRPGVLRRVSAAGIASHYGGAPTNAYPNEGDGRVLVDAFLTNTSRRVARDPVTGDLLLVGTRVRRVEAETGIIDAAFDVTHPCDRGGTIGMAGQHDVHVGDSGEIAVVANTISVECVHGGAGGIFTRLPDGRSRGLGVFGQGAPGASVAVDPAGNVFLGYGRRIYRFDRFGRSEVIMGDGGEGYDGDYGPAVDARFDFNRDLVIMPNGDLWIVDDRKLVIRVIRAAAAPQPVQPVTLARTSTGPYSAAAMQPAPPVTFRATLAGAPAIGLPVAFDVVVGHRVTPEVGPTDALGDAIATMSAGRTPGTYSFDAVVVDRNFDPIESTRVSTDITGTAHPAGTIFPLVNSSGVNGTALSGSAIATQLYEPRAIATGSDGSVYIADRNNHRVLQVTSDGALTRLLGDGFSNSPVEGQLAAGQPVRLPGGVGVADDGRVFVSSESAGADGYIYEIDLGGILRTRAGGGNLTGDSLAGTDVDLRRPYDLLHSGGRLYFGEYESLRYLDVNGTVFTVSLDVTQNGSCDFPGPVLELAELAAGRLAVTGNYGTCADFPGMVILDVDPIDGDTAELSVGYDIYDASAVEADAFAVSPISGDLYFATRDQIIRKNDGGTYDVIAGTDGVQGRDLAPTLVSNGALIDDPLNLAFLPNGDLVIAESGHVVRILTQPDTL